MQHLPFSADLPQYEAQAAELHRDWKAGSGYALQLFHQHHPRFLDSEVRWLPLPISAEDIRTSSLDMDDARLAIARWYSYRDWLALSNLVSAVTARAPGIFAFELAAESVITGDLDTLQRLLREEPDLVRARSSRITHHDPPQHRATLLHYIAANGIEGYRQKSPTNAVEIARALLDAGADPNALAGMYGGECTTMSMLVSSTPPAQAGVQVPLVEVLLDYGASPDNEGTGNWVSPIMTALIFGFTEAAKVLARRGAGTDHLTIAAGLGDLDKAKQLFPAATAEERHRAFALAAQLGHAEVVRLLLDSGEDPNRYNPEGMHAHGTPLHHAAVAGHEEVVHLLVERGARLDTLDKVWKSTPRGWAEHEGKLKIADFLRAREK